MKTIPFLFRQTKANMANMYINKPFSLKRKQSKLIENDETTGKIKMSRSVVQVMYMVIRCNMAKPRSDKKTVFKLTNSQTTKNT